MPPKLLEEVYNCFQKSSILEELCPVSRAGVRLARTYQLCSPESPTLSTMAWSLLERGYELLVALTGTLPPRWDFSLMNTKGRLSELPSLDLRRKLVAGFPSSHTPVSTATRDDVRSPGHTPTR